ncbi:MAG: ABC transporter permease [bacterium]|nr:ABC transporter permease [bacterium]
MIRNYLLSALRNIAKQKLYTSINIFGLAIGLALCLLILSNISYELSFESNQLNRDRIYRLNGEYHSAETEIYSARVMAPLGSAITDEITEVEKAATFRVSRINAVKIGDERVKVVDPNPGALFIHHDKMIFANPDFLDVFTMPLLHGNPKTVLREPFTLLITEKAALKYFETSDPVGETIKINDEFECQVVGILKDIPQNTQLYCDFLISYSTLEKIGADVKSWDVFATDYVYILLPKNVDPIAIERKLPAILSKHLDSNAVGKYKFDLQPLKDIYFSAIGSGRSGELSPIGVVADMVPYGLMAMFILMQAIANFINLSTARSADRRREVGVRKVFGAFRGQLIRQFLGESILIACIAMLLSLPIYELFKQLVNPILPREMLVEFYNNPLMVASIIGLIFLVGVIAGFYPAFHLSRFKTITVLQGKSDSKSTKSWLRRILVVFQFTTAIIFILVSITIYRQVKYVTSYDLGFNQKNIIVLDFNSENRANDCQLMKSELIKSVNVSAATMTNNPLGRKNRSYCIFYLNENRLEGEERYADLIYADQDYTTFFGLELVQGRTFSNEHPDDAVNGVIVNESTLKELGIEQPIGYKLYTNNGFLEIIGVVKNYYGTLMATGYVSASFITINPEKFETLVLKPAPGNLAAAIIAIEKVWKATLPGQDFKYSFLDDEIRNNYSEYSDSGAIMLALTLLSILIALIGILGLVSFTAEQRTKEIGIRKVLGSSVADIVRLLSREFVILITIANLIAWPIAYLMMNSMLQEFSVRISLGFGTFLLAGSTAILLALLTVAFQTIKAANANPVDSLRYE